MIRKCRTCQEEKNIELFCKRSKNKGQNHNSPMYKHECKNCYNERERGYRPVNPIRGIPFKKGMIPWSKLNKGKYSLGRTSIERGSINYVDWTRSVKRT